MLISCTSVEDYGWINAVKVFDTHWCSCVLGVWLGRQKTMFPVKEGPLVQELTSPDLVPCACCKKLSRRTL